MLTQTGLDVCIREEFSLFHGQSVGVVCHQASVARDLGHVLDHMLPLHQSGKLKIAACFGPQHGIWGHTQDNMIEWEGYIDPRTGLKFYSLYGEHRVPTPEMLEGVDHLIFDVQDVGARYYTFIWTLANCMKACEPLGIPITVLDRPNPIGGNQVEGPGHSMAYQSFVGLYPLPVRHGLTVAEVGLHLKQHWFPKCDLRVVAVERWQRHWKHRLTGLPWALPSPNMPSPETALVYPGQCLLEGTKLNEGRGTTRPFEMFGAPYMDGWKLCDRLNRQGLPGCHFRAIQYMPTFHKFGGEVCQGAYLHVTDEDAFRPVLATAVLLTQIHEMYPNDFAWQDPPYEYEYTLLPIDILAGGDGFRTNVHAGLSTKQWTEWIDENGADIVREVKGSHLYA